MNSALSSDAEQSHEKFRYKVCGFCTKKPKLGLFQTITPIVQDLLQRYRYSSYDISNKAFPIIIYKACIRRIKDFDTDPVHKTYKKPPKDYQQIENSYNLSTV